MSLIWQLYLVKMIKYMYSKFGLDIFNTFSVIGYIKDFTQQQQRWWQSSDHISMNSRDRQAKNVRCKWDYGTETLLYYLK